ncbi:hypothetical protein EJB05_12304, partial [Eragrostis curvula]
MQRTTATPRAGREPAVTLTQAQSLTKRRAGRAANFRVLTTVGANSNCFEHVLPSLPKPGGGEYGKYYSLPALNDPRIDRLPYSTRYLLESAIRNCDGFQITEEDVEKIIDWKVGRRECQINMAEPEPDPIRRRRWHHSPVNDDDLLSEILTRLPPRPSSLPLASLFLRGFRAFHRAAPPLLGVFHNSGSHRRFVSVVDPPDRVPAALFRLRCGLNHQNWIFLDCRHGRALLLGPPPREALVWDPMTGAQHRAPLPPGAGEVRHGAVLCGCSHAGDCRSSPFDVVLVWWKQETQCRCSRAVAAVYSSEACVWSEEIVSQPFPSTMLSAESVRNPGTCAGDAIYWLLSESCILEFDLIRCSLALIMAPVRSAKSLYEQCQLVLMEDGGLGLAMAQKMSIMMWKRDSSSSTAGWSLQRSVRLNKCIPVKRGKERAMPSLLGFHEESNTIFVWIDVGVFMIQLGSMQSRMVCQGHSNFVIYPFAVFYTSGLDELDAEEQAIGAPGPVADGALEDFRWQPFTAMWHYTDPVGYVHGPFTLEQLLLWKQDGFFDESFRVWRTDQTKEQSVLLGDTITAWRGVILLD